jgi:tetratricopeptide (TPR) repeat protein
MYNLLIALGAGLGGYLLGALIAGWIAGFAPALLAFTIAYFLLARRTGKQFEALATEAMGHFEKGKIDAGKAALERGFALAPWQFLIAKQIHAQLGAIAYMQRNFKAARPHLEKAWSRQWNAMAMLAVLDHREGKTDAALARMEKTKSAGAKEAVFWGLYAWLCVQAGQKERALAVLAEGLKKVPGSEPLKGLRDQLANDKKVKMTAFGQGWYQFYPEDIPREQLMAAAQKKGVYSYPQPRR